MPRPPVSRLLPLLLCLLSWLPARTAHAQQYQDPSMLDPDEMALPSDNSDDDTTEEDEGTPRKGQGKHAKGKKGQPEEDATEPVKPGKGVKGKPGATTSPEPVAPVAAPPPEAVPRPPPPTILTPRISDADLQTAWDRWQKAVAAQDTGAAQKAEQELVLLKDDVAAQDMEALSTAFIRASEGRRKANDGAGAMRLVEHAVALSPNLPYARLALAQAYAQRSPGNVAAYTRELKAALQVTWKDPRYRRPALADLGAVALLALLATAVVVVGVLFIRRVRYLLHDFHHLFPRAAARWQSAALGLLLLIGTPVALQLGLVPVLLILLASVSFYLSTLERGVAAVLLLVAALVPFAAGQIARSAIFAGTEAEDVYVLEHGGLSAEAVAQRVRERLEKKEKEPSFAELFALGRFEARRGQIPEAIAHYKAAAAIQAGHAGLMTNLANALLATGDSEAAARMYAQAATADPSMAAPAFNLAEVYRRRAAVAADNDISSENQKARDALGNAQRLDSSLLMFQRPPDEHLLMNRLLLAPALTEAELPLVDENTGDRVQEQVQAQLSRRLLGSGSALTTWGLLVPGALAAFALGFARKALEGLVRVREVRPSGVPAL